MSRQNLTVANAVRTTPARAESAPRGKIVVEWREELVSAEKSATPIAFNLDHIRTKPEIFVRKFCEWLLSLQAAHSLPSQAELRAKHAMASAFVSMNESECAKALAHLDACNARWMKMRRFIVAALVAHPNLGRVRLDGCNMPAGYAVLFDALRAYGVIGSESIGQAREKVKASTANARNKK